MTDTAELAKPIKRDKYYDEPAGVHVQLVNPAAPLGDLTFSTGISFAGLRIVRRVTKASDKKSLRFHDAAALTEACSETGTFDTRWGVKAALDGKKILKDYAWGELASVPSRPDSRDEGAVNRTMARWTTEPAYRDYAVQIGVVFNEDRYGTFRQRYLPLVRLPMHDVKRSFWSSLFSTAPVMLNKKYSFANALRRLGTGARLIEYVLMTANLTGFAMDPDRPRSLDEMAETAAGFPTDNFSIAVKPDNTRLGKPGLSVIVNDADPAKPPRVISGIMLDKTTGELIRAWPGVRPLKATDEGFSQRTMRSRNWTETVSGRVVDGDDANPDFPFEEGSGALKGILNNLFVEALDEGHEIGMIWTEPAYSTDDLGAFWLEKPLPQITPGGRIKADLDAAGSGYAIVKNAALAQM